MLADHDHQLLTAYVDGELSRRQRRHLLRLLRRSPEARALLRRMQEDSRTLRHLPRPVPPSDLSDSVLQTIFERRLAPSRRRPVPTSSGVPAWAGLATAAAVLFVVGIGSYFYFAAVIRHTASPPVARHQSHTPPSQSDGGPPDKGPADKRPDKVVRPAPKPEPPRTEVVQGPPKPPTGPGPDKRPPKEVVGSGDGSQMFELARVEVALPVTLRLADLEQPAGRKKLAGELGKDRAFRLELPCKDGTRALERLRSVLGAHRFGALIDPVARDRIRNAHFKTNYVVYAENLTPEELTKLLRAVGAEDRKASARKPADGRFHGHLVLTRLTALDHKQLTSLMGTDPTRTPVPEPTGPLGTDVRKPVSEGTARQVADALAGRGAPRPGSGKPAAGPGRSVLVLAFSSSTRSRPGSAEVKRFLRERQPTRPGTVQILLVLRGTNA